jgi:hypothetical protein
MNNNSRISEAREDGDYPECALHQLLPQYDVAEMAIDAACALQTMDGGTAGAAGVQQAAGRKDQVQSPWLRCKQCVFLLVLQQHLVARLYV